MFYMQAGSSDDSITQLVPDFPIVVNRFSTNETKVSYNANQSDLFDVDPFLGCDAQRLKIFIIHEAQVTNDKLGDAEDFAGSTKT